MTEHLEDTLRRALRAETAGRHFTERVMRGLEEEAAAAAAAGRPARHRRPGLRWLPAALAAGLLAAFGVAQLRHESLERERAAQAHSQLLLALGIASDQLDAVRAAVRAEEQTAP